MSSVREELEGFVAGRVKAERVVEAVAAAYYGDGGRGKREGLQPLMEIIERAHPGVVHLSGTSDGPGFAVQLAERPFPKAYEPALRTAIEAMLVGAQHAAPLQRAINPSLLSRLYSAVRRFFSAST